MTCHDPEGADWKKNTAVRSCNDTIAGMFNPSRRGRYRQAQSEAAWAMMIDFLKRITRVPIHLAGRGHTSIRTSVWITISRTTCRSN